MEVRLFVKKNRTITLAVLDDGPGIEPMDRSQLFDRFRRGKDSLASGSGLGLAIVASAARQLGAQINMSSGLGGVGLYIGLTWAEWPVQNANAAPDNLSSSAGRTEDR